MIAVVGLLVIAGGAAWWFLRPTLESSVSAQCEEAVRDSLKSPSSAVFHDTRVVNHEVGMMAWATGYMFQAAEEADVQVTDEAWDIVEQARAEAAEEDRAGREAGEYYLWAAGEVDAENGFGANTRSEWLCRTTVRDGRVSSATIAAFDGDYDLYD